MNQEVPMEDIIFGVIVLVIFLIFALVIGRFLSAMKNRRFTRAWSTLIPVIHGKVGHDGGGAAASWLAGTYHGIQVQATMVPNRNKYQYDGAGVYNYFDVALMGLPGRQDWQIEYKTPVLGIGSTGWQIETKNQGLKERLEASGTLATIDQFGRPTIAYSTNRRSLLYSEDVTPRWLPTPERFTEELELLLRLAAINEEMNLA